LKIISGGINSPKGFSSTGNFVGIKNKISKMDLAIVFSDAPAIAAAVFTTNIVKAAPVLWNQAIISDKGKVQAMIITSGNANACTGEIGIKHTEMIAEQASEVLKIKPKEVIIASTGVIGVPLPIEKICDGIKTNYLKLGNSELDAYLAAEAIMTTDTYSKQIAVEIEIDNKKVHIGGMAKGSGMIHPNMATMLSFITTDIDIDQALLQKLLNEIVIDTYNMISVDGDTSTNDQVTVLANGMAENKKITEEDGNYHIFKSAFLHVNTYLAKQIVHDGEGATKFITVNIEGAASKNDAQKLGKSIISSNLVKTAFFGEDANWGRIMTAMGYSGVEFDPELVSIHFTDNISTIDVLIKGKPIAFDEEIALEILKKKEIIVNITLQEGDASATAWGCDLSYDYVKINGDYRT